MSEEKEIAELKAQVEPMSLTCACETTIADYDFDELSQEAYDEGWRVIGGEVLCPACVEKADSNIEGKSTWLLYHFRVPQRINHVPEKRDVPFQVTGYGEEDSSTKLSAWIPYGVDLKDYWKEAFNIEFTEHEEIVWTDEFKRPEGWPYGEGE